MAKFEAAICMCRTSRPVKIYNSVYDSHDSGQVITKGSIFKSSKQYDAGSTRMYYIDDGPFAGHWCPAQMIQVIPAEVPPDPELPEDAPPDATLLTGKYARIKGSSPVVYKNHEGGTIVPNCLRLGDELNLDYAVTTVQNGDLQFRYHIQDTNTEDATLDGKWLLQNSSVELKQVAGIKDEGELVEMIRPFSEEQQRGPMKARGKDPMQSYIPGLNMPDINVEEWDIRDHIPDSWKGVIPENWKDYLPDNWEIPERWKDVQLPEDWLKDLPVDWLDNIPQSWKELKVPSIPEDWNNILPNNWRDIYPELGEYIDNWKGELPSKWWEILPEDLQKKLPEELKNYKFPDKETVKNEWNNSQVGQVTNGILDYVAGAGNVILGVGANVAADAWNAAKKFTLSLPFNHGTDEDASVYMDNIDYSSLEGIRAAFTGNYDAYNAANSDSGFMSNAIGKLLFAHGMPFQYTAVTDRRNGSTTGLGRVDPTEDQEGPSDGTADIYGRSFAKEIAANMPICTIVPGKPKFLTNVSTGILSGLFGKGQDRKTVNGMAGAIASGDFESYAQQFTEGGLEGDYNYYSMEIDLTTYFEYVNTLCHTSARMMGIASQTFQGVTLDMFDWGVYNSAAGPDGDMFYEVAGHDGGVSFAYDPQSGGVSDQISTQTTESSVANTLNGYSAKARELDFLLGYSGVDVGGLIDTTNFSESSLGAESNTTGQIGIAKAINRIGGWLKNSVHGMNIKFPEIWSDSQHTRNYEFDAHFISPYGTMFCKWRYVLVPFFHVFALAAPRSDVNVSQYRSPFLIRAFSKGYFNVEMGIIESLQWKRYGDGSMISEDGVPLQIDVTVSFKDLYHVLTMTNMYRKDGENGISLLGNNIGNFFNNTGLIDMIGTLSGVDVNRVDMASRLELMAASAIDSIRSKPTNYMRHFSEGFRKFTSRFYGFG